MKLPTWEETERKRIAGASMTALERFIHDQEPFDEPEANEWRKSLAHVIEEAKS